MALSRGEYQGKVILRREAAGLVLTETRYPAGCELPDHEHEDAYFCLILEGAYRERYGRRERDCHSSMLVFHPAEERHSQKIGDKPVVSFNVEADAAWDGMGMAAPVFDSSACCQGDLPALLALRMYREFQAFDDLSAVTMEGLALQLLASAARQSDAAWGRQPGWMPRVEEFLRAHYTRAFSLSEVAAAAGVHPVYLSGAFRKSKGCTVGDYVRRLRVDLARAALAGRDRTLQAIAADCGFSDQSHFTRVFHRLTGLTPAEYRRRMDGGRLAG